jgi:hypothetical protein
MEKCEECYTTIIFNDLAEIPDIITHIFLYIPIIYHNIYKSICKSINENINSQKCLHCNTKKIFLPITTNDNKLYCFDCLDKISILGVNNISYKITKEDKKFWERIEDMFIRRYINCKYCKVKCSTFDFCHYHLFFKCNEYISTLNNYLKLDI